MTTTASRRRTAAASGASPVQHTAQNTSPEAPPCQYHRLPRHGKPDLFFSGCLLGGAWEHASPAEADRNWWEIALYKTSVGAYLLASTYHVVEEGDRTTSTVIAFCEAKSLREFFDINDGPVSELAGSILLQAMAKDHSLRAAFAGFTMP
ncbi:hypothetical protein [Megalodesulfovibrio gigas]|uniref:hypothetical protein n=1 Tax=Megalodesulfovibrio gigas TaxID=879 RepID=UPI000A660061|nr:hypothetical protein [Megalodesulfovibrio gigas]